MKKTAVAAAVIALLIAMPNVRVLAAGTPSLAQRVRVLEDREQIRALLKDYGRQLDRRDFDGFAKLFSIDSEYVSGGVSTRGPAAIGSVAARDHDAQFAGLPRT